MVSRVCSLVVRCIALASCLLLFATPSPGFASQGRVFALHNTSWDNVQVEIRLGPSSACDLYPAIAVRTLKRGESWAVVANGTVCWRRETIPGALPLVWTQWQTRAMPATGVSDVAL